jgi:hypothetical protein
MQHIALLALQRGLQYVFAFMGRPTRFDAAYFAMTTAEQTDIEQDRVMVEVTLRQASRGSSCSCEVNKFRLGFRLMGDSKV